MKCKRLFAVLALALCIVAPTMAGAVGDGRPSKETGKEQHHSHKGAVAQRLKPRVGTASKARKWPLAAGRDAPAGAGKAGYAFQALLEAGGSTGLSPAFHTALALADKRCEEARAMIGEGRAADALDHLDAAVAEMEKGAAAGWEHVFLPAAVDAYIFVGRDDIAFALLKRIEAGPASWPGTVPREGLLLAIHGRLRESSALDPARYLLKGFGESATNFMPALDTQRGIVAAWCLAVVAAPFFGNEKGIQGRYYRMALNAQPGLPFLEYSYGCWLEEQHRLPEAMQFMEKARDGLTGILRLGAESALRDMAEYLAKQQSAGK